jgi:4-hydroxy-tetrahydrodipicolinate synthase
MQLPRPFRGIIPPLLTPLKDWQTLDVGGLEQLVKRLLDGGVHGLFLLGTSGEGTSLGYAMRRDILDRVSVMVGAKIPLLAGITDSSIKESIAIAEYAAEKGCAGLVLAAPYYHPISQDNLKKYLDRLAEHVSLPVFLYNMPSHTKVWFEIDTLREAFQNPKFVGLKDSSGDLVYFDKASQLMKNRPDLTLLIGPEHLLVSSMQLGGHGGICGGAHLLPKLFVNLYHALTNRDTEAIDRLEHRLQLLGTLYNGFQEASFLGNMKCALSILGICDGEFAEPLHPLPAERIPLIADRLKQLGITVETLE